jgi:hypothetical protein
MHDDSGSIRFSSQGIWAPTGMPLVPVTAQARVLGA